MEEFRGSDKWPVPSIPTKPKMIKDYEKISIKSAESMYADIKKFTSC
jgi:hypothetical protein